MKSQFALLAMMIATGPAFAQDTTHSMNSDTEPMELHAHHQRHSDDGNSDCQGAMPVQDGQAAFAAIQEVVSALNRNPDTDWSAVNIEALRRHLIDMNNVTMEAQVSRETLVDGMRFFATSSNPDVVGSLLRMVVAHAETMDGVDGFGMKAERIDDGVVLEVVGDSEQIRGLGFVGIMALGMHHGEHHWAIATGQSPHAH